MNILIIIGLTGSFLSYLTTASQLHWLRSIYIKVYYEWVRINNDAQVKPWTVNRTACKTLRGVMRICQMAHSVTQRTGFTRVLFTVRTSHSFRAHVYLLYCMYVHNSRTALPMAVFTISQSVNSNTCIFLVQNFTQIGQYKLIYILH